MHLLIMMTSTLQLPIPLSSSLSIFIRAVKSNIPIILQLLLDHLPFIKHKNSSAHMKDEVSYLTSLSHMIVLISEIEYAYPGTILLAITSERMQY